jgi:hypothetical protein
MSVVDLNTIASEDRKHFILCPVCNIYIACRDLGEVFAYMHDPKLQNASTKEITKNYTTSWRADEPNVE